MKAKQLCFWVIILLTAACNRESTQSDGNGPGNADGVGGRADPPPASAGDHPPASNASAEADAEPVPPSQ
jgi:hypothetical protein